MSMLSSCDLIAFVATAQPELARAFYAGVLGLPLVEDTPVAIVFDAHGTMLRIAKVPSLAPAPQTVLGWSVPDIAAVIDELTAAGVALERYDGMPQDARGVWASPAGAKIAWFKDPDGNVLSLTEFPPA